ncbi:ATP-binding protein [Geomonas sp. RF6]|uniref:sensor histidine kinase n=1 Tax=Geomonas sp. RF6 TaxID=2897342 RepID=UPI001E473E28|nr:ATP-binding protein [Geomonas sp. RF6]UFS71614.1 ATP-binding protein [Geomonas sp. RF6]
MTARIFAQKSKEARIIAVGLAVMAASWFADTLLDAGVRNKAFLHELLHPSGNDFAMRCLYFGAQFLFLLYLAKIMKSFQLQGELLEEALLSAKNEKARSDAILQAVGDAISIQDPDYRILYQNEAHKELLGSHEGDICYEAYQQRTTPCPSCHIASCMKDGLTHKCELSRKTLHGQGYLEMICTPLRDGHGKVVAGIEAVRDVTERVRAEREIKRMNEELEQHARELASANRDLEAFNYSLSHDLRTYITRISTAQQILAESCPDAESRFLVQSVAESCRGMDELIEAMLTLSQVSHKELELGEVDLSAIALETALHLQQHAPERQARIDIEPGITVRGDRQLLKICLENLLGNAWKYTGGVREPAIVFGVREEEGKRLYYVRDNGAGFSMEEAGQLFKPFKRLQNSRGIQGSGVGLATVQRVIQRHGGEVKGEGKPGEGAVFSFSLPE